MTNDRWERAAAMSGVAVGALFVVIIALAGELPKAPAPGADVSSYFAGHRSSLLAVAYLEGLAGVAMMWFWGVMRSALARVEQGTGRLANVVLAAGTAQALLYTLSGAFVGALAYHANRLLDATTAALVYRLGLVTFAAGAFPLGAALLATAVVGLRSRVLPSWFSWISGAMGVIALILRAIPEETYGPERIGSVAFFLIPVWFAVAGLVFARRATSSDSVTAVQA